MDFSIFIFARKIIPAIAIVESIFIYFAQVPRNGLSELYLIPLAYGLCVLTLGKWINHNAGLGLRIFFIISILRYLVQPLLIILSDGELNHRMPEAQDESYHIAIMIYILEVIISFGTIHFFYDKEKNKAKIEFKSIPIYNINTAGWIVVLLFLVILIGRYGVWMPELKILGIKESSIERGIVMDASFFNCLKGFFFVYFLSKAVYTKNRIYLFLAVFAGLFNFLSYFGQNRSFIFETALTTIMLFSYTYSNYKKLIYSFFIPFAAVVVILMFVTKQFGVDDVLDYDVGTMADIIVSYSNILEEYVNGFWTVARSYQASIDLPVELSVSALIKDIMEGLSSLRDIPFLKTDLFPLTDSLLSSSDIFKLSLKSYFEYAQMLSFSGGFFIVFGTILGWPAMIIGNYLMIRLLIRMDSRSTVCSNLYYRYIYIWMACLMGLIHCYCLQTIIFCWSKYILFIWLILFVNNLSANAIKKSNR